MATHLLRVACGLDSMVLGDVQILGQVKEAYRLARQAGTAGVLLDRLLETALHAGKRARAETAIGAGHVSMSSSAVAAAVATVGLRDRRVLVVGAGETARLAARHAADHDPAVIAIANRSLAHAEAAGARGRRPRDAARLAARGARRRGRRVLGHQRAGHRDLRRARARGDGARGPAGRSWCSISRCRATSRRPPLDVPGVTLRTLDTIRAVVDRPLLDALGEVPQVEAIVADESERFSQWTRSLGATPTLVALARALRAHPAARSSTACCAHATDDERQRAERLTRALVNRLLHVPTLRLKEADAASTTGSCGCRPRANCSRSARRSTPAGDTMPETRSSAPARAASRLALWQTEHVIARLAQAWPQLSFERVRSGRSAIG